MWYRKWPGIFWLKWTWSDWVAMIWSAFTVIHLCLNKDFHVNKLFIGDFFYFKMIKFNQLMTTIDLSLFEPIFWWLRSYMLRPFKYTLLTASKRGYFQHYIIQQFLLKQNNQYFAFLVKLPLYEFALLKDCWDSWFPLFNCFSFI